ncbi:gamma-glutamylcyclotransferase (GGCT)/AIG2-like uncharacterized protein YtfP [Flavobacteriaceae bacterium MAR_2009_75]|nr:gamma-glutamylcyclotransferase (GGCT)/AIG2-like uncharacterized protein YtfP [Flavobacteriaceae bacterium MAR_2009_75]
MPYIFSYGTLRQIDIQEQLFGRKLEGEPDELLGFELSLQKAYGKYPIIVKTENHNSKIGGVAFQISEDELLHTDIYEGSEYSRIQVPLKSGKQAWVYVAK